MRLRDIRGLDLAGANSAAIVPYERAMAELQCYRADPVASVEAAIAEAPGFAMAHVLKAWLHLLGTEPGTLPVAREAHATAAACAGTVRETGHVAAIGHLVEGRWHQAGRVLEDVTVDASLDALGWWHLALYHFDLGDFDTVLSLFDNEIGGGRSGVVLDLVDASALLWRLSLRGLDVGERWLAVADRWAPIATAGNYAFNDAHAVMAFVGAGRRDAALAVLAAQREAMVRDDDNAAFTREVGNAGTRAILAFGDGDYASTVVLLRPVRTLAHRFGGSHAQRDLIDLTLIEAAFRAGQTNLAAALAAERHEARHESPLAQLFLRRAAALSTAA